LISSDIGRPLNHLTPNVPHENLVEDIKGVLKTLVFKEKELQTTDGAWFLMRISPYRTTENMIEGAVITFIDISELKKERLAKEAAWAYAHHILSAVREPMLVLDKNLRIIAASQAFYRMFQLRPQETLNRSISALGSEWDIPTLKRLLQDGHSRKTDSDDVKIEQYFPNINQKMSINARKLTLAPGVVADQNELILLAIDALG
jgi:two-component system CheB/CheR fusion protein